ncbi:hypothetical protein BKA82DRAFT_11960 [Pisolithus tinctorius]|uniref:Uncharacterized protein n=1 Tax=Pisolithus tinctorius Marx 270 TaxID=870435 RepID=A0A0C3PIM0_PISTI|nr:hypothetical protein BKA82DRAFT_11960 [Pisolithus tinctorius]KIO13970.1 hypothetical protein M404DRAFT_11960 [Pisolithus tinctorius Marx 270]
MDVAGAPRCVAMDAQRFDPMRRTKKPLNFAAITGNEDMGQMLSKLLRTSTQMEDAVGGIWEDHELVFVPIELCSRTDTLTSSALGSSSMSSSSSESTTPTTASYGTSPSSSFGSDNGTSTTPPSSRHTEEHERDNLVITRTILRPAPPSMSASISPRPPSLIPTRSSLPLLRPLNLVLRAFSCISGRTFDDLPAREPEYVARRPVLQVIVTQTREQYEHDMAFKEAAQEICPEAFSGRSQS